MCHTVPSHCAFTTCAGAVIDQVVSPWVLGLFLYAGPLLSFSVRDPTKWTIKRHDGPNHLGLLCDALPEHQMALINSDRAPPRCRVPLTGRGIADVHADQRAVDSD